MGCEKGRLLSGDSIPKLLGHKREGEDRGQRKTPAWDNKASMYPPFLVISLPWDIVM